MIDLIKLIGLSSEISIESLLNIEDSGTVKIGDKTLYSKLWLLIYLMNDFWFLIARLLNSFNNFSPDKIIQLNYATGFLEKIKKKLTTGTELFKTFKCPAQIISYGLKNKKTTRFIKG